MILNMSWKIDSVKNFLEENVVYLVSNISLPNISLSFHCQIFHCHFIVFLYNQQNIGDVEEALRSHFRCTKFALQISESTDVTGMTVVFVVFRYIYKWPIQIRTVNCLTLRF